MLRKCKRRKIADIETVARPIERLRIPELRREILRRVVLHHATRIGGNTLVPAVFAMHEYLVQGAMFQAPAPIAVIKENTPHTVGSPGQRQAAPLPTVEVTEQKHLPCPRQPLAEPPSVRLLVALETEIQVSIGIVGDTFRRLFYLLQASRYSFRRYSNSPSTGSSHGSSFTIFSLSAIFRARRMNRPYGK